MDYIIDAILIIVILVTGGIAMAAYNEKYTRDQRTTCESRETCQ